VPPALPGILPGSSINGIHFEPRMNTDKHGWEPHKTGIRLAAKRRKNTQKFGWSTDMECGGKSGICRTRHRFGFRPCDPIEFF
ncbi:MAG: hypothetical protein PHD76_14990, partial [Methylacidiphilales bacterium]|nr:hypothetical protein [Candidatus Methylacidiphilales bacterium]